MKKAIYFFILFLGFCGIHTAHAQTTIKRSSFMIYENDTLLYSSELKQLPIYVGYKGSISKLGDSLTLNANSSDSIDLSFNCNGSTATFRNIPLYFTQSGFRYIEVDYADMDEVMQTHRIVSSSFRPEFTGLFYMFAEGNGQMGNPYYRYTR